MHGSRLKYLPVEYPVTSRIIGLRKGEKRDRSQSNLTSVYMCITVVSLQCSKFVFA